MTDGHVTNNQDAYTHVLTHEEMHLAIPVGIGASLRCAWAA
jgi:hypothetical protein